MNDLEKKILLSSTRIKTAIKDFGSDKCAVACSFGKDSMTILKLTLDVDPNIPVVWSDTKCEHPETYKFAEKIIRDWKLNIHIARAPEGVNFWTIAKEYGLPGIRGDGTQRVPKCCQILKDGPAETMYKELGIKCVITGITSDESRQRFMLMKRYANKAIKEGIPEDDPAGYGCGARYYGKTKSRYTLMPIIDWTVKDVWSFHDQYDIPYCPVYDINNKARLGCVPCTAYRSWRQRMPIESPATYRKIIKILEEDE